MNLQGFPEIALKYIHKNGKLFHKNIFSHKIISKINKNRTLKKRKKNLVCLCMCICMYKNLKLLFQNKKSCGSHNTFSYLASRLNFFYYQSISTFKVYFVCFATEWFIQFWNDSVQFSRLISMFCQWPVAVI